MKLSTIRSSVLEGFTDCIVKLGGDPNNVLKREIRDSDNVEEPLSTVPIGRFQKLLNEAALETATPHFGLYYGARYRRRNLGFMSYLFSYSDTLLGAIKRFERNFAALQTNSHYAFRICGKSVVIEYAAPGGDVAFKAQDAEFSLMLHCRFLQFSLGGKWMPQRIDFQHEQLGGTSVYAQFLQCDTRFGQGMNQVVFASKDLFVENQNADRNMLLLIERALEEARRETEGNIDPVHLVRRAIVDCILSSRMPTLDTVAQVLGVSRDTLGQVLRRNEVNFRQLQNEERIRSAKGLLREGHKSIGEISAYLQYSEISAFSRNFKKVVGLSPNQYRQRSIQENPA
ncbi:AraC family transcriptional regulator ligand-binding domain-containing protein [Profundibacter sp.]|uniref:AraC family transcriptional regulator n=1 Tax=Profundibacter sp. TaxID=3101071 RepID=UPI003D0CBF58